MSPLAWKIVFELPLARSLPRDLEEDSTHQDNILSWLYENLILEIILWIFLVRQSEHCAPTNWRNWGTIFWTEKLFQIPLEGIDLNYDNIPPWFSITFP